MSPLLVVDASVAAKWFFHEVDQARAQALIGRFNLLAPDLLLIECANVIWKRWRNGEVARETAVRLVATLRRAPVRYRSSAELISQATALAIDLDHPVYDCLYLSLALVEDARVVTCDRRFVAVVGRRERLAAHVALLGELATE